MPDEDGFRVSVDPHDRTGCRLRRHANAAHLGRWISGRFGGRRPPPYKHRLGKARIRIRIPRKRHGRHGRYISPSTQSISIATTGQKTVVANLTRASSNCTTVAGTGLVCTINVTAEVGSHQFSFVTYDGLNATGNALSANTLMLDVLDKGTTPLNVTLGGIAASIAFSALDRPAGAGFAADRLHHVRQPAAELHGDSGRCRRQRHHRLGRAEHLRSRRRPPHSTSASPLPP